MNIMNTRELQIDRHNEMDIDILVSSLDLLSLSIDLPYLLRPLLRGIRRVQCVFWDRTELKWDGLHIRVDICPGADAQYVDFV